MSLSLITIDNDQTATEFATSFRIGDSKVFIEDLGAYFQSLGGGVNSADVTMYAGAVKATALIAVTANTMVADETITIGNVVLTAKASGATTNQFNIGGSAGVTGDNIAEAINASANGFDGFVVATDPAGTGQIILTAKFAGETGNAIQLSEAMTGITVTQFSGGSNGSSLSADLS